MRCLPLNPSKAFLIRLLTLVLLPLTACSTGTRLAYNNLGTLARWEAGKYVEMTPAQKTAFDAEFKPVWDWHRRTQLPLYAVELRSIARQLDAGNPDRAAIDRLGEQIDAFGSAVGDRAQPGLARLLALIDDDQVQKLLADRRKEFDKAFRKQRARTPEQWREKEQREDEDAVETWIGPLNPAQKTLLAQNIEQDITQGRFDAERIRAERNRQLDKLAALLAARRQPDAEQRLRTLGEPAGPAEKQARADEQERSRAELAALSASLDPAQRQYLRKKLLGLADDCDALTARAAATASASIR